jgi:peptide/nickel transport system substrate-binding protein
VNGSWLRLPACAAIALAACTSHAATERAAKPGWPFARGGVVHVAILSGGIGGSGRGSTLDPSREYQAEPWEILRCCLLRTLYQYSGQQTEQGGAELRPDLAAGPPSLSADGLTWTIHIRPGLHYAPPLQHQEIVAQDFVTALKRVARVTKQDLGGDYAVYYSIIRGFDAYAAGQADAISGISTPDSHTLVFSLTARTGDFADRLSLAAAAPIPTLASAPGEFGVATGHDQGYGSYLVASGPYMLRGSGQLDPGAPPKEQKPAPGFLPGASRIDLVRNPSWDPATDHLRPAYPDRIRIQIFPVKVIGAPYDALATVNKRMDAGSVDVLAYAGPYDKNYFDQYRRYRADPSLGRAIVLHRDSERYASMNLAQPPFDDVHVRRAANYIVDKNAYLARLGGPLAGAPATHTVLDSLEGNQLVNYDPYRSDSRAQALTLAENEMRLSKYDTNSDGRCDAKACRHVETLAWPNFDPIRIRAARSVARDLARIGIQLRLRPVDSSTFYTSIAHPTARIPLGIAPYWSHDYLNGSQYVIPLFAGPAVTAPPGPCCNYSLVGARPASLHRWGYSAGSVPSIDDRINECLTLFGRPQTECWTALDQYLTEVVVPWIPLMTENSVNVVPARVRSISYDQFTGLPSLDRIVMKR